MGSELTYTVTLTNNGPDSAHQADISDTLPPGTTLLRASQGGAGTHLGCFFFAVTDTSTVVCQNHDLGVGQSTTAILVVQVKAPAGTPLVNNASSTAYFYTEPQNDPIPGNDRSQAFAVVT